MPTDDDEDFYLEQENFGECPTLTQYTDEEDEEETVCPHTLPLL